MDGLDIEIEGDSDAAVALALLKIVMRAEGKDEGGANAYWILRTYQRCLAAVAGALDLDDQDLTDNDEDLEEDDEDQDEPAETTPAG